jgi:hypothetical protein
MKKRILGLIIIILVCIRFFSFFMQTETMETKPLSQISLEERKGLYIIQTVTETIKSLDRDIDMITDKAPNIVNLKQEIANKEKQIRDIKSKSNILQLEKKISDEQAKIDLFAAQAYAQVLKASQGSGQRNLYAIINDVIREQIYDNPDIKAKMTTILLLLRQISDIIKATLNKIHRDGQTIANLTKQQELQINKQKNQTLPIQQEINRLLYSEDMANALDPIKQDITDLKNQIQQSLNLLPDEDQRRVQILNNIKQRLILILDFLRDPESIQNIPVEKILGLEV